MNINKIGVPVALLTAALTLTACAANESGTAPTAGSTGSAASVTLTGQGASTQQVAMDAWKAGYQKAHPDSTVNYSPVGSGTGRKAFIAGAADWAGSDAPLSDAELGGTFAKCAAGTKPIDLPTYVSPIALAYNVEGVSKLNLNADVTAKIFTGTIAKWNDAAIAALNPGVALPDLAITAVHRSDDSGTTENFTDWLHQVAPASWPTAKNQTWPAELKGEAAAKTSGVVAAVKNGKGTIGYADESQTKGMTVANVGENGTFAAPTAADAGKVVAAAPLVAGRASGDLALELDRKASGYPIVLVSYSIACTQYSDAATGSAVKSFLSYVTSSEGQEAAVATAGNAPLPSELAAKVAAAVGAIK